MKLYLVEVELTLIERFVTLLAPQNGLYIFFGHFKMNWHPYILGIMDKCHTRIPLDSLGSRGCPSKAAGIDGHLSARAKHFVIAEHVQRCISTIPERFSLVTLVKSGQRFYYSKFDGTFCSSDNYTNGCKLYSSVTKMDQETGQHIRIHIVLWKVFSPLKN
jgi:hypothetical protein